MNHSDEGAAKPVLDDVGQDAVPPAGGASACSDSADEPAPPDTGAAEIAESGGNVEILETEETGETGETAGDVDEVLANFKALLHDVDFSRELRLLGIRRFDFLRRRRMQVELRAMYVGLWFLALRRSFPHSAEYIFSLFLKQHAARRTAKRDAHFRARAQQYREMLELNGDKDFTIASRHLLSFSPTEEEAFKALSLRLALSLRATYTFIFERLF